MSFSIRMNAAVSIPKPRGERLNNAVVTIFRNIFIGLRARSVQ